MPALSRPPPPLPSPPLPPGARSTLVEGLRAVAALMVIGFHFAMAARLPHEPAPWMPLWLEWCFEHGWLGVQLFFVLSGFVIAASVRGQAVTAGFVGRFALRRSLRLDPPYWVVIALEVALFAWMGSSWEGEARAPTAPQVAAHLLYLQDVLGLGHVVGVFWTLCLEMQLYLGFVLLLLLAQRASRTRGEAPTGRELAFLLPFAPLAALSVRWLAVGGSSSPWATRYVYMFLLGAFTWWTLDGLLRARWLAAYGAVVAASAAFVRWEPMAAVALATAALLLVAGRVGGLTRWLAWAPLQWVGRRSYSLYLIHLVVGDRLLRLVLDAYGRSAGSFALGSLLGLSASVGSAALLHRWVEGPSQRWSRRVALGAPVAPAAVPEPRDPAPGVPRPREAARFSGSGSGAPG